jgi:hypothetical protein
MIQCERCGRWFRNPPATASQMCDPCWEDLGQMVLFEGDDTDPPIDTIFDRDREARGEW